MNRLIRSRGLSPYVSRHCASACTLAFLVGADRLVGADARRRFHQFPFPGLEASAELELYRAAVAFLVEQRVSEPFAGRVFSIAADTMWYPKIEELIDAGVVTGRAPVGQAAMSEVPPLKFESLEWELLKFDVVAAIKEFEPDLYQEMMASIEDGIQRGWSVLGIGQALMPKVQSITLPRVPYASDEVVLEATRIQIEELAELRAGGQCRDFLLATGPAALRARLALSEALRRRDLSTAGQ